MCKQVKYVGVCRTVGEFSLFFNLFMFFLFLLFYFPTATDSPQGVHVQACLRRVVSRELGMEAQLQDHANPP